MSGAFSLRSPWSSLKLKKNGIDMEPTPLASLIFCAFLSASALPAQTPASASTSTPVIQSAYGVKLKLAGLPNGGKVNSVLFRGAQPQIAGLQELKKLGVTTIVDLRGEDPDKTEWERRQANELGFRFISIPVSGWSPPSNADVAQFLALFRSTPKEKVFVHCRFGDDRTGVFVAAYRMAYEGWPAQQAMNEMYFFGFNGLWHPAMKSFVRDFPALLKSAPDLAQFRAVESEAIKTEAGATK
jgi:tyrosine-protein phosphatase SIW14